MTDEKWKLKLDCHSMINITLFSTVSDSNQCIDVFCFAYIFSSIINDTPVYNIYGYFQADSILSRRHDKRITGSSVSIFKLYITLTLTQVIIWAAQTPRATVIPRSQPPW